jgi:hypothetical protein
MEKGELLVAQRQALIMPRPVAGVLPIDTEEDTLE